MAVRELVGRYESKSEVPSPSTTNKERKEEDALLHPESSSIPTPHARLHVHPLLRRREPSGHDDIDDIDGLPAATVSDFLTRESHGRERAKQGVNEESADVADERSAASTGFATSTTAQSSWRPSWERGNGTYHENAVSDASQAIELHPLLPVASSSTSQPLSSKRLNFDSYPGSSNSHDTLPLSANTSLRASTATLVPASGHLGPHTPIAANTIFSRKAAPLSIPRLDNYIASLPAPSFPTIEGKGKGKATSADMLPPMDQLAASCKSLTDLEHNATVAPFFRNRDTILSSLVSIAVGVTGSSVLASFYSLQGLFDTVQIFALILNTIVKHDSQDKHQWEDLLFGKIPNVLALNFASTLVQSLIMLVVFMTVSGLLLYYFYRVTSVCRSFGSQEGPQPSTTMKNTWGIVIVSFLLTVIYLPLSTMAVHVLVWSDDLWVVPNPYTNATSNPPVVPPLGPANEFRDPLDFCWTTTMKRNDINYAPILVIIAIISFAGLTVWFPIYLFKTIKEITPVVNPYTELGTRRSRSDMNREYQRLLLRDRNPLSFIYNGYRRGWGTYQSTFLLAKLTALLITAIINPNNCLFRTLTQEKVSVTRQMILLVAMLVFLVMQCIFAPFLNPVNNASEFTSRLNYVLTSAIALGVALNIPGEKVLNGVFLLIIYIITYGLSFYFSLIGTNIMRRTVKRLARRIDFSIDIFSPRVDLSPSCPHTKRRIWQEALTTLLLTDTETKIPKEQTMQFKEARDDEYPPYLLNFAGSAGERHVENLRILREVGSLAYNKGVALVSGPDHSWFQHLVQTIQNHFVGPDCHWRSPDQPNRTICFGNAWWVPFPPTVVMRYDDGSLATLREVSELETYVTQNSSHHVQRKREIRMALRALDGQVVMWPYDHVQFVGAYEAWCCCRKRYGAEKRTRYQTCTLTIKRMGQLLWEDTDLGSGFKVSLKYAKNVEVDGSVIGVTEGLDLTQPLARFLAINEHLISARITHLESTMRRYRHFQRRECEWKARCLTYGFLSAIYDCPQDAASVIKTILHTEIDGPIRQVISSSEAALAISYERHCVVSTSELATWWYTFWDDLWRRNYDTIKALAKYESDFSPHYPTSIAYRPLPRAALEAFLIQRGLLHKVPKWSDFFHAGFLNKMYLRMNDVVFHGLDGAIILHLGDDKSELDMEEVDIQTLVQPSTLGTGGGTSHDDSVIRARPLYRWEGILEDPLRKNKSTRRGLLSKVAVWFGLSPLWRSGIPSQGLAIDVQLVNGQYELLEDLEGQGIAPKHIGRKK
ncbi:hypothetical protein CERSUDRAFT_110652 [Gelatoporia subvermispora B]|uniref:Uncharacterized protein n=1 Tax=Ceriporiopsis subvermispora (strain B) TaxID=914234 RepID=M2PYX9_CERS8|nr:hypothetical protein CERSUDRAFT_110652 [Gelatoporia subvermispora B]